MIVYRLTKSKYKDELSGMGAQLHGGRWNSKGVGIIYTGESRALCVTEVAVHVPLGIIPSDYHLQSIQLPECDIAEVSIDALPTNWNHNPAPTTTKIIGDTFIKANNHLLLKVPSAVIGGDFNYLINPSHSLFNTIKLIDCIVFKFDTRLFIK